MTLTIKIEYKNDILFVKVLGEFTEDSAISTFDELLENAKECRAKKALVDCRRDKVSNQDFMTTFFYSQEIAKRQIEKLTFLKLAYLFHPEDNPDLRLFGETVAKNRGVNGKVFFDYDDSINWLIEN